MRPVRMIACHYANKSGRGQAACFVTEEAAQDLVEAGQAVWSKRCKYLNFTKTEAAMHRPAPSLLMGSAIIQGYAEGRAWCAAIVSGWTPCMIGRAG